MPSGRMPSVSNNRFGMVPRQDVPRSSFTWPFYHKTTFNGGFLIPLWVREILPGDSFQVKMHAFARLSVPIVPMMDNLWFETAFWFVPNRIVWANWKRFMGEQDSPSDTTEFTVPQIVFAPADLGPGKIPDYMGIPPISAGTISVNCLPFRGLNRIWNEFYRDQDLQSKVTENTNDGPDLPVAYPNLNVAKRHDYFTSARPWPEKPFNNTTISSLDGAHRPGGSYVMPPRVGAGAPVSGIGVTAGAGTVGAPQNMTESGNRAVTYNDNYANSTLRAKVANTGNNWPDIRVMVNDIRTSMMVQRYLEKMSRGGSRYSELVEEIWGVRNPDARLQRPEYLGGGRTLVTVNPVAQTAPSGIVGTTTKFGEQAGIGTLSVYDHGFSHSFSEHGFVFCVGYVRSDLTYQQGVDRQWWRRTPFDHYNPVTAHLGEQAVLRREIYEDGVPANGLNVFGYQERWAEYRSQPSRTSGYFRSTVSTPLDMWHLAENFLAPPALNNVFVVENAPINRVLQSSINFGQQFLLDSLFMVNATRCMPMFSIPGLGPRI